MALPTTTFLRDYLAQHYTFAELSQLCEDMNEHAPKLNKTLVEKLDAQNIPGFNGGTLKSFAQGIVQYMGRRSLVDLLVATIRLTQAFANNPFLVDDSTLIVIEDGKKTPLSPWTRRKMFELLQSLTLAQLQQLAAVDFPAVQNEVDANIVNDLQLGLLNYCDKQHQLDVLAEACKALNLDAHERIYKTL